MTRIEEIRIEGSAGGRAFLGSVEFPRILSVVSAPNTRGKSTIARALAWCLGLEPMFGAADGDFKSLPPALWDEIELEGELLPVTACQCVLKLRRGGDGHQLVLTREVQGAGANTIAAQLLDQQGRPVGRETLAARRETMKLGHGFQRFLFQWLGLPLGEVGTATGGVAPIYLENLFPLLYLEQNDGWSDLQAGQVFRYRQLEIQQAAVEYLLGMREQLGARLAIHKASWAERGLRMDATAIEAQVQAFGARHGWTLDWSANGSVAQIEKRWSSTSLREVALAAGARLSEDRLRLSEKVEVLRSQLSSGDAASGQVHSRIAQRVIELKEASGENQQRIRVVREQQRQTQRLLESLTRRRNSAAELAKLKRLAASSHTVLDCPLCHRPLDSELFGLESHPVETVEANVDALGQEILLVRSNLAQAERELEMLVRQAEVLEAELLAARNAMGTVNESISEEREKLAELAYELNATQRDLDRLSASLAEMDRLQALVQEWITRARGVPSAEEGLVDPEGRLRCFRTQLGLYLQALGHSAMPPDSSPAEIALDDRYVPYIRNRRVSGLGSGSDRPRLVAAYTLALAATSAMTGGNHPGFVVLDEPLQQNPDDAHREKILDFGGAILKDAPFQTIVLTTLQPSELSRVPTESLITPAGKILRAAPSGN